MIKHKIRKIGRPTNRERFEKEKTNYIHFLNSFWKSIENIEILSKEEKEKFVIDWLEEHYPIYKLY